MKTFIEVISEVTVIVSLVLFGGMCVVWGALIQRFLLG